MGSCDYKSKIESIRAAKGLYIYGAGHVAESVAYCLMRKPFKCKILAFVVSDVKRATKSEIFNIPVISFREIDKDKLTVIAVMEIYEEKIVSTLRKIGASNYISLTFESDLWNEVRKEYFRTLFEEREIAFNTEILRKTSETTVDISSKCRIYVVKSVVDKIIKKSKKNESWENDIQVGASLSEQEICETRDNTGDNISAKNRQYCEMTALYWMWKNAKTDYVGLCHYRRRFDLTGEMLEGFMNSDFDILITTPLISIPNVKGLYASLHSGEDWEIFKTGVSKLYPEYMDSFEEMENGVIYVPYNMFITKRQHMMAYCRWAFPLFEYCEKNFTPKHDGYQIRDIGFLSERVVTLYLIHNRDSFNIVFADKVFYK